MTAAVAWRADDEALLHGLSRDELNGRLVTLHGLNPRHPDRWSVEVHGQIRRLPGKLHPFASLFLI